MGVEQPRGPKEVSGLFVFPGKWDIDFEYAAGKVLTEFFKKLKDKKIEVQDVHHVKGF